jgi:hypothetical protein
MWKIAEAYTNLDTVKIRYILHVLDLVETLLCESNVENAEACTNLDTVKSTYILHVLDLVEPLLWKFQIHKMQKHTGAICLLHI